MKNPIVHAVEMVRLNKLTSCKRCGCPALAWAQLKSGRWILCPTYYKRPFYRGEHDNTAPEGFVYALKARPHRCDEFLAAKAKEAERLSFGEEHTRWLKSMPNIMVNAYQWAAVEAQEMHGGALPPWWGDCANSILRAQAEM